MNTIPFNHYPEIWDKIFLSLDYQSLLKCELVCKQWKEFLDNPMFWLKILKTMGQPLEISDAWKRLINNEGTRIPKIEFTNCLRKKFKDEVITQKGKPEFFQRIFHDLNSPPLHSAAYHGHLEIVKLIHDLKEDYDRPISKHYFTPNLKKYFNVAIFTAIYNGHNEIAKFLADQPREVQSPSVSVNGLTPLSIAVLRRNLELVQFFGARTTNFNFRERRRGQSLIHLSLKDFNVFKYMISLPGINPNLSDNEGQTPLQILCTKNFQPTLFFNQPPESKEEIIEMVKILAPMAKNTTFQHNNTPIHVAAEYGALEILEILIEHFDVNIRNDIGHLPLDRAIRRKKVEAVNFLAPYTKNYKLEDYLEASDHGYIKTPIQYAARNGLVDILKILINHLDLNDRELESFLAISEAIINENVEVLKILVKHFDVNRRDTLGFLPIDLAILRGKVEAVKILASYTKELKVHKHFRSKIFQERMDESHKNSLKALEVMETLIKDRAKNKTAKRKNMESEEHSKKKVCK